MKRLTQFLSVVFFTLTQQVYCQILSPESEISLITLGPYQSEVYSAFGHSAIRVYDPANNWDSIYNYGIFDFNQPNFYLNFAAGNPYYKLGVYQYNYFLHSAIRENRRAVQQVLNLTLEEKQRLFDFLQWNARPENCNYFYNYIYDNCATRIRDVMDSVFAGNVQYSYNYVKEDLTFRDLMDLYLKEQPWGDLGIDLCLGTGIDKVATGYHYMFIPDYVEHAFAGAIFKSDSTEKPLIKETINLNEHSPESSVAGMITPLVVSIFILLVYVFITYRDIKLKTRSRLEDTILFSIVGIVGWFLIFLLFFTNHISQISFNLIWAMPLHFPIAFLYLKKNKSRFMHIYFLISASVLGLFLVLWRVWPQDLHESLIPLLLALLIRYVMALNIALPKKVN